MTGSLTVKNGKYYALLNVYVDGKRKKKWIYTGLPEKGNKRKAEQFLREKIVEYERMEGIIRSDILFSDYIRFWLTQIARKVDIVTLQGYQIVADGHILPYFDQKKIKLVDMDYRILQTYIDTKHKSGRLDGKGGLSPKSIRAHKNVISQALDMAVKNKLLISNPCQFVILPPLERYESTYYNEKQLKALFAALDGDPLLPLIKITAIYGLRRSELLGLQWDSIDFDAQTMTIRHTVSKVTEVIAKDKTKNISSRRTFPLTPEALDIFRTAKKDEELNRLAFGREYQENLYVFKWADGHTYSPDYLSHRFNDLLKKHSLPHIRFHELRHSCASILIAMGWTLKDVQEWLGHSDIQMTANIYSHLEIGRKADIAASLGDKFAL
jgi:integrase